MAVYNSYSPTPSAVRRQRKKFPCWRDSRPDLYEYVVDSVELGSYSDYSPYEGWNLKGWPVRTMVRGVTVMHNHPVTGVAGHGRYIARSLN